MENNENNVQNQKKTNSKGLIIGIVIIVAILFITAICICVVGGFILYKNINSVNKNKSQSEISNTIEISNTNTDTQNTSNNTTPSNKQTKSKVSKIDNEICGAPNRDGMFYILITAYDDSNKEVWTYKTKEGATTQYVDLVYIGENNGKVYLEECGTIVALDRETGKVAWKNEESNGYFIESKFDSNGNLYLLCSSGTHGKQPVIVINKDGKTVVKDVKVEGVFSKIVIDESNQKAKIYYSTPQFDSYETQIVIELNISNYTYTTKKINPDYKYDKNGYVILNNYSGISSFWGRWEDEEQNYMEIVIGQDEVFVTDHYTRASEVFGTYKINGDTITFTNDADSKTWKGQLLGNPKNGKFVLKVTIDGEEIILNNTDTNSKLIQKNR